MSYNMVGADICHTRRTRWSLPHTSGRQQCCRRRQTVLYPTMWATRLGSIHTLFLSLSCKAIPFIYKRGCALSQKERAILTLSLLGSRTLKPHRAYVPRLSSCWSSRHSWPFGLESDRTSNAPILFPLVCNPRANFEHLGSGIKSLTD